jgi:hypothetical protein
MGSRCVSRGWTGPLDGTHMPCMHVHVHAVVTCISSCRDMTKTLICAT